LVETLKRGIGNVLAVVFGRLLFAEPVTGRKLAAVALMAAGVALLLLA
jgi:multidrug transporter EmrE-like cation transporter